jgi:hypothetical protein
LAEKEKVDGFAGIGKKVALEGEVLNRISEEIRAFAAVFRGSEEDELAA